MENTMQCSIWDLQTDKMTIFCLKYVEVWKIGVFCWGFYENVRGGPGSPVGGNFYCILFFLNPKFNLITRESD